MAVLLVTVPEVANAATKSAQKRLRDHSHMNHDLLNNIKRLIEDGA